MMQAVRRILHLQPVSTSGEELVEQLRKLAEKERNRAERIRKARNSGNYVERAIMPDIDNGKRWRAEQ